MKLSVKKWRKSNRDKYNTYIRNYRKKNPKKFKLYEVKRSPRKYIKKSYEKKKDDHLKSKYGLSFKWFKEKLFEQNNVCAICGNKCKSGKSLSIDHNHKTDKIRGLLCSKCNPALGYFDDNIELLEKAIIYLKKYR